MLSEALAARHEMLRLPRGRSVAYRDSRVPRAQRPCCCYARHRHDRDLNWEARSLCCASDSGWSHQIRADTAAAEARRPISASRCADDVVARAEALGIELPHRRLFDGRFGGAAAVGRHPERISRLVLGASSLKFLGTPAERQASLFAPAFTAAARMNPLCSALAAGMLAELVKVFLTGALNATVSA